MNPDRIYEAALAFWSAKETASEAVIFTIATLLSYAVLARDRAPGAAVVAGFAWLGLASTFVAFLGRANPELFAWATLAALT